MQKRVFLWTASHGTAVLTVDLDNWDDIDAGAYIMEHAGPDAEAEAWGWGVVPDPCPEHLLTDTVGFEER